MSARSTSRVPDLSFTVEGAEVLQYAASPHLAFKMRIANANAALVHSVVLRSQVQLEVARRRYTPNEQSRLIDLFGETSQWAQTLHSLHWAHTSTVVPSFTDSITVDLPVPCTFDFNAAATKYFGGLDSGDVPVTFMFSGTIFYATAASAVQAAPIPWDQEASYRLPVSVWRSMMELHYSNSVWLCLARDAFDRLNTFKTQRGLPTFEQAIEEATA